MVGFSILCVTASKQVLIKGDIQQGVGVVLISLAALLMGGAVGAHFKKDDLLPGGPDA
jgi:ABC-type uncharacterized transport system permease subunit